MGYKLTKNGQAFQQALNNYRERPGWPQLEEWYDSQSTSVHQMCRNALGFFYVTDNAIYDQKMVENRTNALEARVRSLPASGHVMFGSYRFWVVKRADGTVESVTLEY